MKPHSIAGHGALAVSILVGLGPATAGNLAGTIAVSGRPSNADVVVYIQQVPGTFRAPTAPVEMDERNFRYIPHVLPVMVGSTVKFLNSDPTPHNVFSPDNEKYNLGT